MIAVSLPSTEPGFGLTEVTTPSSGPWIVMLVKPADCSAATAWLPVMPRMLEGTVAVVGAPEETTRATSLPRCTLTPVPGSVRMT